MRKTLLYSKSAPITIQDKLDLRPHLVNDIYEYDIRGGCANPFGIIAYGFNVHTESMYSSQLPLGKLHEVRLLLSSLLKKKIFHHGDVLSITHAYYDNFYHFTTECLMKLFLLKRHLENPATKIVMPERQLAFHREWFDILGISDRILAIKESEIVKPHSVVTCSFPANNTNHHKLIIGDFRKWVLEKLPSANKGEQRYKKLFIGRRPGIRRNIRNIGEVLDLVSKHGFSYLEMDNVSLREQIDLFKNATHIIGLHGAALSNLIFARKDARIIELVNDEFHVHIFEKICAALSIPYSSVRCKQVFKDEHPNHADIEVNLALLDRLITAPCCSCPVNTGSAVVNRPKLDTTYIGR